MRAYRFKIFYECLITLNIEISISAKYLYARFKLETVYFGVLKKYVPIKLSFFLLIWVVNSMH